VIELRNIYKSYRTAAGPNLVLDDVCLHLSPCESIGLIGRNGAGKSTLLRIIGGAEMPDYGEVIRRGRISWPIGFAGGFNRTLSGEENCRFVARIYGQDVDRVIDETRDFAEIGNYFYEPVRTYSSGMRARLAFGLSMAIDFDLYLVDEITAVGDKRFKQKCLEAFYDRQQRSGLIMVSHNLDTLREYCQRCGFLHRGRMRIFNSVDEASEQYEGSLAA